MRNPKLTKTDIEILIEERAELYRLYRHHDMVVWTLAGTVIPGAVAATLYGLRNPGVKIISIYISIALLVVWFIVFERIRLIMLTMRRRTEEIEEKELAIEHIWNAAKETVRISDFGKFLKRHKLLGKYLWIRSRLLSVQLWIRLMTIVMLLLNIGLLILGLTL